MTKAWKPVALALAAVIAMTAPAAAMDPFSIRTSLSAAQPAQSCTIPVLSGEVLELSAADLEQRLGMAPGSLEGLTLTSLPDPSRGILYLDGVETEVFETLSREEIDRLCFRPMEGAVSASITFVPRQEDAVSASVHINVLAEPNLPPEVEGMALETLKNMPVSGFIAIVDPEEDNVSLRLVTGPKKGRLTLSGQSFTYEPFQGVTGSDVFTVMAVDSAGNTSQEAVISVAIENTRSTFAYADMTGNPSQYAAVKLRERGVLAGRQVGDAWFFDPDAQLNRGDFLVMLLASAGLSASPTVNTGLPNDSSLPLWLKPYVKAAADRGMISPNQAFRYWEVPIRAEAVLMVDRAAGIRDVKDYALRMADKADIPDWAVPSYKDLAAYKMLDLHDGLAHPSSALTNSYGADLLWQLYKHVGLHGSK